MYLSTQVALEFRLPTLEQLSRYLDGSNEASYAYAIKNNLQYKGLTSHEEAIPGNYETAFE